MIDREETPFSQEFVDRFFLKWPVCLPFGHRCADAFTMDGHLDKCGHQRIYCRKTNSGKGSFTIKSRAQCPIMRW